MGMFDQAARYACRNIEDDDAGKALAEVEADFDRWWGLLFWVALMGNGALAENIAAWLVLVRHVPSKRYQAELARIALVFAELAGTLNKWSEALKEVDMQESKVVLEWTADARRQSRVEALRETLRRQAEIRFQQALTDEDRQMITAQDSLDMLEEWLNAVVKVNDCAAFRAVLRR